MSGTEVQSPDNSIKKTLCRSLLSGVPIGVMYSWQSGLTAGIISMLAFGFLLEFFIQRLAPKNTSPSEAERPDFGIETVLIEGPATHFKGFKGVEGYLWVTDRRLHFAPKPSNVLNNIWVCMLSDTLKIKALNNPFFDGPLSVTTGKNEKHRFAVHNSGRWAEVIHSCTCLKPL